MLVDELDGDAVELVLRYVFDRSFVAEKTASAGLELLDLLAAHGVGERQHRYGVPNLSEAFARRGADPLGRRGRVRELGMRGLELHEAPHLRIVLAVADLGLVEDVVKVIVPLELVAKSRDLGGGALRTAGHGGTTL